MGRPITSKQQEVYDFIKTQLNNKGYPPSIREICVGVNLSSTSSVHGHLQRLEKRGLIKRDHTKTRAIELVEKDLSKSKKEMINVPLVGKITAGMPILAVENIEDTFPIPVDYISSNKELFMLKVSGESMIEAGILDGDYVVLEKVSSCNNGDIVAALIENEATLKRFFLEKDHIRLQPENSTMEPIIVPDCKILGKLVGLYRKY